MGVWPRIRPSECRNESVVGVDGQSDFHGGGGLVSLHEIKLGGVWSGGATGGFSLAGFGFIDVRWCRGDLDRALALIARGGRGGGGLGSDGPTFDGGAFL